MGTERRWTLEAARAMLPEVRSHTARAVPEVEKLLGERDALAADASGRADLDARLRELISRWTRSMEALGVDVKGLWLVDFDNGSGYYCWRWPEMQIEWFHGYEEGFGGRIRIQ